MDNFIAGTGWVRSLDIELGNHLNLEVLLGGGVDSNPTAVGGEGGAGGGEECRAEYLDNPAESEDGNSAKMSGSA